MFLYTQKGGVWKRYTSYKYIYNIHTEKSEFPSDPFRYNRDVSNYSFDIMPINVRDEDGWIGKKMPPPIVPRKVPPISARHLPRRESGESIALV